MGVSFVTVFSVYIEDNVLTLIMAFAGTVNSVDDSLRTENLSHTQRFSYGG